jgi:hypothetical protein
MKKRMILIVMVLAVTVGAWAGRIGEQEARKKASAFMTGQARTRSETTLTRVCLPLQTKSAIWSVTDAPIYIYNYDGGGYVIVSGDDRTADILGFSEKGHIDANHLAENMKAWLQGYVSQIERIPASATPRRVASTRSEGTKDAIDTKLKTEWGQEYPYNLHTPELNISWKDRDTTIHAATGCVATAMAMVLHYYQYPAKLKKAIDSYEGTCDIPVVDKYTGEEDTVRNVKWKTEAILEGTPIDWANITDKYNKKSSDVEKEAVARLMQYCGAAVDMQYGLESRANTGGILVGLRDVMDYQDVYSLHAFEYDEQGWIDAVYHEMSKAGPVLFSGITPSGISGHSFILDGYQAKDGKDYFFVNWGWEGDDNGYMLLSVMEPGWVLDDNGNSEGFTVEQDIVCGLGPQGKGYTTVPHTFYADAVELGQEGKEYSRKKKSDAFQVPEYYVQFGNYHLIELTSRCALGVYDAKNELVSMTTFSDEEGISVDFFYYLSAYPDPDIEDDTFPIGSDLDDGIYTVMLIGAEPYTDNWEPMQNAEAIAIQMTVKGNKCSFKAGGTTAIRKVVAETEENADDAWYSLSGVRLGGKPTTKGVYIHQGRKVMVK